MQFKYKLKLEKLHEKKNDLHTHKSYKTLKLRKIINMVNVFNTRWR